MRTDDPAFQTPELADADIQRLRQDLPTLEAVERRRGRLWAVAGLLLLAASATILLLVTDPDAADVLPENAGIRVGFVGISVAFLLYVFDQERRLRRLSDALVRERILSVALTTRVRDLGTLSRVGHIVNAVLSPTEVLEVVLEGAFDLTGAVRGSVMLVEGDELVVAVSAGDDPAPSGSRQAMSAGVAGWVATMREPVLVTGMVTGGQFPDLQERGTGRASSVVAPMLVAGELVGIVALERSGEAEPFTEWEMRAVALFAGHAATAVANAQRYERERENVERLAQLVERRGDEVARMVHDLKAPLTTILGFSLVLRRRTDLPAEQREGLLARLESAAQQLLAMVEEVLQGASHDARLDVRREPVDVLPLVHDLAELTGTLAQGRDGTPRRVTVTCDRPEAVVRMDPGAVRSMLANLLENAVKYSPPGSPIDVEVRHVGDELRLAVRDRGMGVPPEDHEAIFARFRQRDGDVGDGVGLGLYIVRSLARAHGGRVELQSVVGSGSTFTVALPRRRRFAQTLEATDEALLTGADDPSGPRG